MTLAFDLLIWISIEIIYSSRTIHLPHLTLLGQSILELSLAQGVGDQHDLWPLTYWPISIGIISSSWIIIYLPSSKLMGQSLDLELSVAQGVGDQHTNMCKAICPSFFKGCIIISIIIMYKQYHFPQNEYIQTAAHLKVALSSLWGNLKWFFFQNSHWSRLIFIQLLTDVRNINNYAKILVTYKFTTYFISLNWKSVHFIKVHQWKCHDNYPVASM